MIKNILLFVFVSLLQLLAYSKINWHNHVPVDGDKVEKVHCELIELPSDTSTVWDFSHLIETLDRHEMEWLNFGDSIIVSFEQGVQSTFTVNGDSIYLIRRENALLGLTDSIPPVIICKNLPEKGDSLVSHFYFEGLYCGNNFVAKKGEYRFKNLSYGTLILPNDTLNEVFRVRQAYDSFIKVNNDIKKININENEDTLLRQIIVVDSWFSDDYRYAIMENIDTRYISKGSVINESHATYLCHPEVQEYDLNSSKQAKRPTKKRYNGNKTTPSQGEMPLLNDVNIDVDELNITISINNGSLDVDPSDVTIILFDELGRVWYSKTGINTGQEQSSTKIDISMFNHGTYILNVYSGDITTTKKIQIK